MAKNGWRGPSEPGEFPTLGWQVAAWIESMCAIPDGDQRGELVVLADYQLEWLLNFYRVKPNAVPGASPSLAWVWDRGGQLVGPQKFGKGPLASMVICAEAAGPVLFDGWDANGEPVGRPWSTPWIQVTANALGQTSNIWRALVPMIELGNLSAVIDDTGQTRINLPGGGFIEPVTSQAGTRRGQRITHVAQDETSDWTKGNGGRALADTQRRNVAGMGGRFTDWANAWDKTQQSVAQQTFEQSVGVYKMMPSAGPGNMKVKADRIRMLRKLYIENGATWAVPERLDSEVVELLERDPAQAEMFFFNRPSSAGSKAYDIDVFKTSARPLLVKRKELIVVGVDGARYDDSLAIIATHVESGQQWPLGIWERPEGADDEYEHPLDEADEAMIDAVETWNMWRTLIDPQYIEHLRDKWRGRWGSKRVQDYITNRHSLMAWVIREHVTAVNSGEATNDGDEVFTKQIGNAVRKTVNVLDDKNRRMYVVEKETPTSPNKIDAAPAAALSWKARGQAIAAGVLGKGKRRVARASGGR